jgi:hypothetical protein
LRQSSIYYNKSERKPLHLIQSTSNFYTIYLYTYTLFSHVFFFSHSLLPPCANYLFFIIKLSTSLFTSSNQLQTFTQNIYSLINYFNHFIFFSHSSLSPCASHLFIIIKSGASLIMSFNQLQTFTQNIYPLINYFHNFTFS